MYLWSFLHYLLKSNFITNIHYFQCPPYALSINYRVKLLLSEIIGYNSDIITLQEVDRKIFQNDLEPILDKDGLSGRVTRRILYEEFIAFLFYFHF